MVERSLDMGKVGGSIPPGRTETTRSLTLKGEYMKRKAVFLDRDGTLIKAVVNRPGFDKKVTAPFCFAELEFDPHAERAIQEFKKAGYLCVMITNQPDVAYGYLSESEWEKIHSAVVNRLKLDKVSMCRHRRNDNCPMRKPSPMMLIAAADDLNIDLSKSWMIGDTDADVGAGDAAGCSTILLKRHYNLDYRLENCPLCLKDPFELKDHEIYRTASFLCVSGGMKSAAERILHKPLDWS